MEVTREQLVNGVATFARNEVINKVSDRTTKILLGTVVSMLDVNPQAAYKLLESDLAKTMLMENNGMYEIDTITNAISNSMNEYGNLTIKMEGIKFISPDTKEFTFTREDIHKLRSYITEI